MTTSAFGAAHYSPPTDRNTNGYPEHSLAEYPEDSRLMPGGTQYGITSGESSRHAQLPAWFNSGFRPLDRQSEGYGDSDLEVNRHEESARRAPEPHVAENSTHIGPQLDKDTSIRERLLRNYALDDIQSSRLESSGHPGTFKLTGSRVIVKRAYKENETAHETLQREIEVLRKLSNPSTPRVHESLESDVATWAILDYAPGLTLRESIKASGPQSPDQIKAFITQLFSGIASIFMSGFAHLRICDETLLISDRGQLIISSFKYAYPYGKEKVDDLYAAVEDKCGDDIYVAPEVFANIKYNSRKAVIWSCGVALYFITTATTAPLSVLNHPSFDSAPTPTNPTSPPIGHAVSLTDPPPSPSRRKLSTASQQALKVPLIPYPHPGGRLSVPAWTRDIISKMLQVQPTRRAELIEVAAKVPKELYAKETRPLMELAWLDYKSHVGPLAGLNEGGGDSERNSLFSFSGMSAFSRESLGALLPGRRRSSVAKAKGGQPAELSAGGGSRRKSTWL